MPSSARSVSPTKGKGVGRTWGRTSRPGSSREVSPGPVLGGLDCPYEETGAMSTTTRARHISLFIEVHSVDPTRQVAVAPGIVDAVAYDELVWDLEPHPRRLDVH